MHETQPFLYITPDREFFSEEVQYVARADFSFLCGPMGTIPVQHFKTSLYEIGVFLQVHRVQHCSKFQNVSTEKSVTFEICVL